SGSARLPASDPVGGREPSGSARLPASDPVGGREPSGSARLPASDPVGGREPSGSARLPASDPVGGREPSGSARLPASDPVAGREPSGSARRGVEPIVAFDGLRRVSMAVTVGEVALPPVVGLVDGRLRGPEVGGVLGYDALATVDLALAGDRLAVRLAASPTWHDPAPLRLAEAEARFQAWRDAQKPVAGDVPPRMGFDLAVSLPEGDPGDVETRELFQELARWHWEAHD